MRLPVELLGIFSVHDNSQQRRIAKWGKRAKLAYSEHRTLTASHRHLNNNCRHLSAHWSSTATRQPFAITVNPTTKLFRLQLINKARRTVSCARLGRVQAEGGRNTRILSGVMCETKC